MYAAHNFIVISGQQNLGLFFDYPARIRFDIGFTRRDWLEVTCERADLTLYVITGDSACDVVKRFRAIIGRSYIPPKFAFGFGQSRYGYKTQADFEEVVAKHRQAHIPLDMVYMDIDYMDHYKDFTVNPEEFPDFSGFVSKMKEQGVRLVPSSTPASRRKQAIRSATRARKRATSASGPTEPILREPSGPGGATSPTC